MRRCWSWLGLTALLVALGGGIAWIFQVRMASDLYPPYSSLRADPLGVRALHDALASLPGVSVTRRFQPLSELPAEPPRTLFIFGAEAFDWIYSSTEEINALDAAVRAGSRVVVVFSAVSQSVYRSHESTDREQSEPSAPKSDPDKEKAKEMKKEKEKVPPPDQPIRPDKGEPKAAPSEDNLLNLWGFEAVTGWDRKAAIGAVRTETAPVGLPATLSWRSDLHFNIAQGTPWRVLYTRGETPFLRDLTRFETEHDLPVWVSPQDTPVLLELNRGRGSIVLAADAYFVSNEALQKDRSPELLAWLVGPNHRVEFDESHLGIVDNIGVATLARSYGLGGALLVLGLLAVLFIWRRLSPMVPPVVAAPEIALSYQPTAGLEALLRRSVPTAKLPSMCRDEWRRTARPAEVARVPAPVAGPVADYNSVVRALRRR